MKKIRLNKNEIIKLYDLIDTKSDIFDIEQKITSIGIKTIAISKLEDGDEEYDITDYNCW